MTEDIRDEVDICVVGAGHAGCEAALACARLGLETVIFTVSVDSIALMPCNPNVGGSSKGHLVRELDALGGEMGKNIDKTFIQSKMLNVSKGPAVHSLRAQADKQNYSREMRKTLENTDHLTIKQAEVCEILADYDEASGQQIIKGVKIYNGGIYKCKAVVLCTGTYLNARCLCGESITYTGPNGLQAATHLTDSLKALGIEMQRFKTGTPARMDKRSIDFSKMEEQFGDERVVPFSFSTDPESVQIDQVSCWLTYTNEKTHEIIRNNLDRSPLYSGMIEGTGPRYCPSIEDKIVRFADKERHQLFLEPESIYYDEWYLQGFSTSMPRDVQEKMVHSLHGLENAVISKYAYAIEYDAIDAMQIKPSLETKIISGLFTAGQINGTSGYEEAAGQGLVAGINASLKLDNKEAMILKRSSAYIGVLIDDLVTKGITDPYRMLTSRAEFRLLLRHDNADERLTPIGYEVGSVSKEKYSNYLNKKNNINKLKEILTNNNLVMNEEVKEKFIENNLDVPKKNMKFIELLKRPEISIDFLANFIDIAGFTNEEKEEVTIEVKYEGYIKKEYEQKEKLLKMESKQIPKDIDYNKVKNIASEARQKLSLVRPETIAQASRISGVNPVDISLLLIYLKKEYNKND